ncbi:MAG: hypothetical protein HYR62_05490 [Actinobacteria bacterium]|nr:hypothetical protein [Actinomycetota bacterium]MBI3688495.1 hypothetical protein [Actinomycetota bacterium]
MAPYSSKVQQRCLGVVLDVVYNHLGPRGAPHKHLGPYFHLDGLRLDAVRHLDDGESPSVVAGISDEAALRDVVAHFRERGRQPGPVAGRTQHRRHTGR